MEQVYHQLHSRAERSWQEEQTTDFLHQALERMGILHDGFKEHTGLVAEWKGAKPGPVVVLRTDIDALWQNIEGVWKANHSCGHDCILQGHKSSGSQ